MDYRPYDDRPIAVRRLDRAAPQVIWGALMAVALAGAGATVWRAQQHAGVTGRPIAADDARELGQDVRRLAAERDRLVERLARLERGFGELEVASRSATGADTTGSIARPGAAALKTGGFALSLGPDATVDAVRRRWIALAARYPEALAKLNARALRSDVGAGVYDLIAGPFATRAEADRTCMSLADQGLACDTTVYAGDPIERP